MARPVRHSGCAPVHRLLLSSSRHLPLILGVSFGSCLSTAGLDLQQGMRPRRTRDVRPGADRRLVRLRHHGVERGAESRAGTNGAEFHFLEMDRVFASVFSCRVSRCEAIWWHPCPHRLWVTGVHSTVRITGDLWRFIAGHLMGNEQRMVRRLRLPSWPGYRRVHVDRLLFPFKVLVGVSIFSALCSFAPPPPPPTETASQVHHQSVHAIVREQDSTSCGMAGERTIGHCPHLLFPRPIDQSLCTLWPTLS